MGVIVNTVSNMAGLDNSIANQYGGKGNGLINIRNSNPII